MAAKASVDTERRHIQLLTFVPVVVALLVIWGGLLEFAVLERTSALEHVQTQLASTVTTLADFNELAERPGASSVAQVNAKRSGAFWHALLQFPGASFWVESRGRVVAGQPPSSDAPSVVAQDARETFTVRAALPEAEALKAWRRATWVSVTVLSVLTLGCLLLARFLGGALRQRAAAEREAVAALERATQLALYRTQLEETVARRTEELAEVNSHLETELVERRAVEGTLRERDALLGAVTKSAAELLGSQSYAAAIGTVLELIGKTLWVGRVQATKIEADPSGHCVFGLQQEWCAPELSATGGGAALGALDLASDFPELIAQLRAATLAAFHIGARSVLCVPVFVESALWGSLNFIDASDEKREWTWAETDTLKTLAGLVGIAVGRERYVKQLADANTIVENSPTVLYRLGGEPPYPLLYISSNIAKFGHAAATLMDTRDWVGALVDPRDRPLVDAAFANMVERGAPADSVEFRLQTGGGAARWVESRYFPRRDAAGRLLEVEGVVIDIDERKAAEEKIELLARTDSLTGLANRATFLERLQQAFAAAARGAQPFAIMYLDLDSFKSVNDTLGHGAGDLLLRAVAARLVGCTRDTDLVARLGGDEFAILQAQIDEPASAGVLAAKMRSALDVPYLFGGDTVHNTASIGICPYSASSAGPDAMLAQADLALYRSKQEGRNRYCFYSADLDREVLGRVELAGDLKEALERGELEFYCEPQIELTTGKCVNMKARVRWQHATRGLLAAGDFLPLVEKTPSGVALGYWLLDMACREMARRRAEGSAPPSVAIDVRFWQLKNGDDLLRGVQESLVRWALHPADLEFDVTEETLAEATLSRNETLARLRSLGVEIAIADFGTEYSSFDYIRAYSVSRIELSPALIAAGFVQPDVAATIRTILEFAREIGIGIVAEGLETEAQRAALFAAGRLSGEPAALARTKNVLALKHA